MSIFHRAILYVIRKWSKTLVLFLILLVIATLTLSGVAIQKATETAQLNVRQALGGVFTLTQNRNNPSKWVSTAVGSYGSSSYYGGAPLTAELANYIQQHVLGISGSNATYTNYVVPLGADGSALELLEGADNGSGMNALMASYGDFNATVAAYASTNTAFDSYFTGGYIELVDGRHFTDADKNAAIISRELAEKNGLKIGDKLTLKMSDFKAQMMGYNAKNTSVEVEIVGLFQASVKSTTSLSNWSMDNSIYTTLDVIRTARPDMGSDESYEKIQFYVSDPGELNRIVEQVQALPELDPTDFVVSVDASNADAVMEPLSNMSRLVTILIVLVIAVGAVILYLVLASRIKERVHESGVLLSLGLSKWNIGLQYLVEILLVAVLAFSLSTVTSGALAQVVGDQLLDYSMSDSGAPASAASSTAKDGVIVSDSGAYAPDFGGKNSMTKIEVSMSPAAIMVVFLGGFFLIALAVLMAALPVLKMKPREILSKMS